MRGLITAAVVACFGVALADEVDKADRKERTLTADAARSWIKRGGPGTLAPGTRDGLFSKVMTLHREVLVVHAEIVEPPALLALSRKHYVVYKNLKTLGPEHLKLLDKDVCRPSLPSLASMTLELSQKLSKCTKDDRYIWTSPSFALHLCGLKNIDEESLRCLKDVRLCLCGLESLSEDEARALGSGRDKDSAGVLLSNKTKLSEDAWTALREQGGVVINQPPFDPATFFEINAKIRVIDGRCRHREIAFLTDDEKQAKQPRPPPPPNPFNQ